MTRDIPGTRLIAAHRAPGGAPHANSGGDRTHPDLRRSSAPGILFRGIRPSAASVLGGVP
jgi:hypothetical protein